MSQRVSRTVCRPSEVAPDDLFGGRNEGGADGIPKCPELGFFSLTIPLSIFILISPPLTRAHAASSNGCNRYRFPVPPHGPPWWAHIAIAAMVAIVAASVLNLISFLLPMEA